jgi:two-component system, chemotaxis family, sensor kinase CheA
MSDMADHAGELRLQIDELATTLLVDGPGSAVTAGLKNLSTLATDAGYTEIAAIASRLVESLPQGEEHSVSADELLQAGFAQLQAALNAAPSEEAISSSPSESAQGFTLNSLAQDPELVGDFILEAREHLAAVEGHMLTLEKNPDDKEAIHAVFRGFHTIKGLAGFLEFMPIRDVAHEVETLLDLARNGKLAIAAAVVDVVLESVDYLKHAIEAVELTLQGNAAEPLGDNRRLLERVQKLSSGTPDAEPSAVQESEKTSLANLSQSVIAARDIPLGESHEAEPVAEAATDSASKDQAGPARQKSGNDTASVRVHTAKLDYLMDMVGEMVITQSLIRHNPAFSSMQNPKLIADLSQLARITSEVQRTTMAMRMITVGQVFQRSSRLVRDLSRKAGKKIQLEISGEETEIDKTIAEELTDPLLHMVRNSADHGVEDPRDRAAAGKNPVGKIRLAAYHQGGQIVVEISDDGRGLDREKILNKAIQKGLVEPGAHLSEQEIFNLIFEPGFSTAAQVTDISGRGVGMDVVRKNIQKLRGRIEIQSKVGQGTTFFLKLPLTLAIIEGLVVGVGNHRYIVPIFTVKELINPKRESLSTVQGRNEMAMVRDRVLPVLRLSRRFGVQPKSEDPCQGLLIVIECQERQYCLLVDEVLGKQEVVIKSLGETLKNIPGIAGGAILGDGRVGLILDPEGVFRGDKQ